MSPFTLRMPRMAMQAADARIVSWLVARGDSCTRGMTLALIATDKAVLELEALHDGVVTEIFFEAPSPPIPVDTPIAMMETRW